MREKTLELLKNKQFTQLKLLLNDASPVDVAALLSEMEKEDILLIFRLLSKDLAAETFVEMDSDNQEHLIQMFTDKELKAVVDELYVDDAVDIIEEMPANVVKRILKHTDPETRKDINEILKYPKDSAGSMMTTEYVSLKKDMTVMDAFEKIRQTGIDKETIYTCYVTDSKRKLKGVVTVKELLLADENATIREIMEMMTIPYDFRWVDCSLDELNRMAGEDKKKVYKANEVNIRQCLGEAVPTEVLRQVAERIRCEFQKAKITPTDINRFIANYELTTREAVDAFVQNNPEELSLPELQRIVELCNAKREENAAYFTNKFIVNEIMDVMPDFGKDEIRILEPSVGAGGFLPFIFKRYENVKHVILDLVDIDSDGIATLKILLDKMEIPNNFTINIYNEDFLLFDSPQRYDLAIGNPPYSKLKCPSQEVLLRIALNENDETKNLSEMFLGKTEVTVH